MEPGRGYDPRHRPLPRAALTIRPGARRCRRGAAPRCFRNAPGVLPLHYTQPFGRMGGIEPPLPGLCERLPSGSRRTWSPCRNLKSVISLTRRAHHHQCFRGKLLDPATRLAHPQVGIIRAPEQDGLWGCGPAPSRLCLVLARWIEHRYPRYEGGVMPLYEARTKNSSSVRWKPVSPP